jgi:hypothetical protein
METDITKSIVYKESTDKLATSTEVPIRVKQTIQEIAESLDNIVDRESPLHKTHLLGKMYRNSVSKNANSSEILIHFFNCYYELLHKELEYNNNIEKIEIIKKSIKTIQNTLEILKISGFTCDGEKFKALMRAFCI